MSDSSFGTKDIWVWNWSEIDCCEIVKYSWLSHRQPLCIACTFGLHSTCHLEEIGDIDVILKTAMMAEQLLIQSVKLKDSYRLNIKYPGIEDNINELLSEWNNFKSN